MESRPIKYSDLIAPDNSINELIAKLEQLGSTFATTIAGIRQQASGLAASLQQVNGATQQGQQATQQAAKETDKLAQAQKQLSFAQSENAKELAKLKAQIKETNDITKLQEKLNRSAEGSYNRLSAQYSLNKIRLNQMAQAERENTVAGRQLVKETNDIYQRMKQLQEVTGKYQLNVGNYTNAIISAIGANRGFAGSIMNITNNTTNITQAMQAAGGNVKAFGTALLGLLTNPVFLVIAGIAATGAAFKFWMDYNDGIGKANRLTREFLTSNGIDATEAQVNALRGEVQAMADVFDKEYKETLEGVDTLMSQFGITAKQAIDVMNKGFAAGADLNGDMINKIKQYAPAFHDAGIGADELLAIIQQTRSGILSDGGLDAITMASRKLRDMSKSTRDALQGIGIDADDLVERLATGQTTMLQAIQEVSKGLSQVGSNTQQAGAIITEVFGRSGVKAGQQQLKALQDIELGLDAVLKVTGEYGKAQLEIVRLQKEINQYTEALFGMNGWEQMKLKAQQYAMTALAAVLKGTKDVVNWFIRMYNQSVLVRGVIASIGNTYAGVYKIIWQGMKSIVQAIEGTARALEGLVNRNFKQVAEGAGMVARAWLDLGKGLANVIVDGYKNGLQQVTKGHLNEVTIGTDITGTTDLYGSGGGGRGGGGASSASGTGRGSRGGKSGSANAAEQAYKKQLEITRKAQDAQLALEQDQWRKQRIAAKYKYNRQIEDLTHQLDTEKSLTEKERGDINATILSLQAQLYAEWNKIEQAQQKASLEAQKKTIALRLQAVKEGSEEEYRLKLQQVEIERRLNIMDGAGSTADINAVAAARARELSDEYVQAQMAIFDKQQEYAENEFLLLQATEAEKTKFRLEQERARWKKILEINALGNQTLSDEEIANIRNIIKRIDNEIDSAGKGAKDIYEVFGINLNEGQKEAINTSLSYAMEALNTFTQAAVQAADAKVQAADKEVSSAQKVLETEMQARANGYANNVALAQKELEQQKKNQQQAIAQQRRAQKQQEAVQTIQQMGNLVTATSMIWSQLGFPWAIPAIAVMWGSFIASKVKAAQVTKNTETYGDGTVELLEGGSHASGNDIDLGMKKDGTRRRAEGGEFFAVINKRSSRKFRGVIPDVIKSLNDGTFADKYSRAYDGAPMLGVASLELGSIGDDVRAIRDNSRQRVFVDGIGRTIIVNGNNKRIIR